MLSTIRTVSSLLLLSLLLLPACGGKPPAEEAGWETAIAFQADTKLGGCDVGDLDPRYDGREIAAVAVDGRVYVTRRGDDGWVTETAAQLPGEGLQCAIGDVDPDRPGNELVVVGMAVGTEDDGGEGAAHLVYLEGDEWKKELILEQAALVHGVGIGDVDPDRPGNEVVVTGFTGSSKVLVREGGTWKVLAEHPLPEGAAGKTVLVIGNRAHIANTSEKLVGINTPSREIGTAQARLGGGETIAVACDDGGLRLVTPKGVEVIHRETQKLRGAAYGDFDPYVEGEEAATVGYEKKLTVLYRHADGSLPWRPLVLWTDTVKFHHLAVGEILAEGAGPELVAVGYSGRVIVAWRTRTGP